MADPRNVAITKVRRLILMNPQVSDRSDVGSTGTAFNKYSAKKSRPEPLKRLPTLSICLCETPNHRRPPPNSQSSLLSAMKYKISEPSTRPDAPMSASTGRYHQLMPCTNAAAPAGISTTKDGIGEKTSSKKQPTKTNSSSGTCSTKRSRNRTMASMTAPPVNQVSISH